LDEEPKSILLGIISQLRIGMDLSKITLPVFVLEPRSMLERITDFIAHADIVFDQGASQDPEERFLAVLRCYLAGWHIKPSGVKKPYNPILGEIFRCRYDYADGTCGYYVAEQVSHHPPISAFYYVSPDHKVVIRGELRPKSKFLGNSAANMMEGANKISFLDRPQDGEYNITMPNMYARGILFGKMVLELGDEAVVSNDKTDYSCRTEFKTKGFVFGDYNDIAGKVKHGSSSVADIDGKWSDTMYIKKRNDATKQVFFDSHSAGVPKKSVTPESDQLENESRRLWSGVTDAIKAKDLEAATDAKSKIEDAQRDKAAKGQSPKPRFFKQVDGEWKPDFVVPEDLSKANEAVAAWIWPDTPQPPRPA